MSLLLALTGSDPVAQPTFSQEVALRPVYVRRGKKIHLFSDNYHADQFLEAERIAADAIAKASRKAKRRIVRTVNASIDKTVDIDLLSGMAKRYAIPADLPALVGAQDWPSLFALAQMALQLQDEEDIELLLLA